MVSAQPPAKAQTIKQAKASFKARARPTVSEREQKQLERSAELDRRAWRLREQAKKKSEFVKARQDKEREEREELERTRLGTQRRYDRFGYKSSQLHLGAFFGRGHGAEKGHAAEQENMTEDEYGFGDDGVDDETLLDVLQSPQSNNNTPTLPVAYVQSNAPPTAGPRAAAAAAACVESVPAWDDFELESSTQIARELECSEPGQAGAVEESRNDSFSCDDFDITVEDLENASPSAAAAVKAQTDRKLMPPPALPLGLVDHPTPAIADPRKLSTNTARICTVMKPLPDPGFTLSQLEEFVDDDLQLTQTVSEPT